MKKNVPRVTIDDFQPNADELLDHNARYVESFADHGLQLSPRRHLAIVACMDSRMDIFQMLGLSHGDAHVIRNAGGVVTDDVIRSLVISQRLLGTREVLLVHHTNCGLQSLREDEFKQQLENETGVKPWWSFESFRDPFEDTRQSINRLRHSPFLLHKNHIRGFVYDVDNGRLLEVTA
jgi:carbonic anhydrase